MENPLVQSLNDLKKKMEEVPFALQSIPSDAMNVSLWSTDSIESGFFKYTNEEDLIGFFESILEDILLENKDNDIQLRLLVPAFRPNNETGLAITSTLFVTFPEGGEPSYPLLALRCLNTAATNLLNKEGTTQTEGNMQFFVKGAVGQIISAKDDFKATETIRDLYQCIHEHTGMKMDGIRVYMHLEISQKMHIRHGLTNLDCPLGYINPFFGDRISLNQAIYVTPALLSVNHIAKQL
jgi:hypothetical protein